MITKELLEEAIQRQAEALNPEREALKAAEKVYNDREEILRAPILKLCEEYFDQELKDNDGNTIAVGSIINNGQKSYKVVSRGMQWFFGTPMMNPSVNAKIIIKGNVKNSSKSKNISRSELKEFSIVEG
jgi:hypothetical protein